MAMAGSIAMAKKQETGFLDRTVTIAWTSYRYQVFVPEDWNDKKVWPVILFLHGSGERGDDGLLQTDVGLPSAIRMGRERFPSIVVIPQCRKGIWWTDPKMEDVAIGALE